MPRLMLPLLLAVPTLTMLLLWRPVLLLLRLSGRMRMWSLTVWLELVMLLSPV